MEGYKKVPLRDHLGNIILPVTSADVVSENPDRRFVDNIEKTFLGRWGGNLDTAEMLIEYSEAIRALSTQEPALTRLIDQFPTNFSEKMLVVDQLMPLLPHATQLIQSLDAPTIALSDTSHSAYLLRVDDTGEEPKLVLIKQEGTYIQPTTYKEGDSWLVENNAPDVSIKIDPDVIAFYNGRKTVLTFEEGLALPQVSLDARNNIINGVQNETVSASDDKIPQAFVSFKVKERLEAMFAKVGLEKTITGFTNGVLSQPMDKTNRTVSQAYMNSNVVQPAREATKKNDYTSNIFQHITWTNTMSTDFISGWLNKQGQAGVVVFGDINTSISIAKPTLTVTIKNPYIGKTLVATKDMDGEFSILDWKVK